MKMIRAPHRRAAAEQRYQLRRVAAGSLASCTSTPAQGDGAQSLWHHGCVQRLSQRSSVERRSLRLLSWLTGFLGYTAGVLNGAVACIGIESRQGDQAVLSACVMHTRVPCRSGIE